MIWMYFRRVHTPSDSGARYLPLNSVLVKTTREKFENGAFRKHSLKRKNWKTSTMRFSVDGNHLKTEVFENDDVTTIT